jgi:hypothetical protein
MHQRMATMERVFLRFRLAFLMILLAAPAYAENSFGGGIHGRGFHGGGFHAFHRRGGRARGFFVGYGYGYNCGFGFDCGGYDYGYGSDYGYGQGYGSGYFYSSGGTRNAVSISNGLTGGYVPDPVGAEIPPLIIPKNCWVRRAAYDPSGAYFGQVLVNLCRPSDSVTATDLKARAKPPETGTGGGQPAIDHKNP